MQKQKLNTNEIGMLMLLTALIFGGIFRFLPTMLVGFPINDGGMFYTMMQDLQANHFIPPLYTTYNNLQIPFAYPPLALYIGALISSVFHISLIEILRWLPALINVLCIPAFYFLAKEILDDTIQAGAATLVFAFVPHLSTWLSAGGGITRSFGTLFMILTILYSYKLFAKNNSSALWGVIIFGSLTVLSHTESTVFAIALPMYIWIAKSRSLRSGLQAGAIALGVLVLAGPWYGLIISRHGFAPLLSALQTGGQTPWALLRLTNIDIITEEPYLDLLGVCGVLGMIFLIIKKQYFIPMVLLIMYVIQPRSAHTVGNIPLAMAAGVFIIEILLPAFSKLDQPNTNRGLKIFLLIVTPYLLINSIYQSFRLSLNHVPDEERTAMQWVKENTAEDSQFLVLTSEAASMCESSAEWFPALSERTSLNTIQGTEWLTTRNFNDIIGHKQLLQACLGEDLECLTKQAGYFGKNIDYIYVSLGTATSNCEPKASPQGNYSLISALENSTEFQEVFRGDEAVIFERK